MGSRLKLVHDLKRSSGYRRCPCLSGSRCPFPENRRRSHPGSTSWNDAERSGPKPAGFAEFQRQIAPNFWLNPRNSVSYPLVVQTPTYRVNSVPALMTLPLTPGGEKDRQLLMNVASLYSRKRSHGGFADEHPAGFRCARRCAGARSGIGRRRY